MASASWGNVHRSTRTASPNRWSRRGFTLVELMIVVAVVGVLAVIALVGFQKYQRSAASGEARAMLQNIRGSEDAYKAEVLSYKECPTGAANMNGPYYPRDQSVLSSPGANDGTHKAA